jgi:hypothetical protein
MNQRAHDAKFKALQAINAFNEAVDVLRQERAYSTLHQVVSLTNIAVTSWQRWPVDDPSVDVSADLD